MEKVLYIHTFHFIIQSIYPLFIFGLFFFFLLKGAIYVCARFINMYSVEKYRGVSIMAQQKQI